MEKQTAESLMGIFEQNVAANRPISPAQWVEGALHVNILAGDLDNQLAHIEAELNHLEAEYIKQDMPANKAKVLARSQVDYEKYLNLRAILNRVKEFLSLARRRAQIPEI